MTILNEKIISIITGYEWGWTYHQTLSLFGILFFIAIIIFLFIYRDELNDGIVLIPFIFLVIIIACWRITQPDVPITQDVKQYTIILDDNYSANKLLQNYNLIEVNGLEYIIQDKIKE